MKRRLLTICVVVISGCVSLILSSTEEPVITLSMGTGVFGDVNVGGMKTNMLTYTPQTGSDDDTITDVAFTSGNCSQFSLMGPPPVGTHMGTSRVYTSTDGTCQLPMPTFAGPGSSMTPMTCPFVFGATFAPTTTGMVTCNVTITYHPTTTPADVRTEPLTLTGNGVNPAGLTVSPPSVNFGNVPMNGSSAVTAVDVKNSGTQTETVSGNTTDPSMLNFQIMPTILAPHALMAGAKDTYNTWCHPTTLGPHSATLSFHAVNGGFGSDGQSVLSCTGIMTNLMINPVPVSFATTLVGRTSGPRNVMITNTGSAGTLTVAPDAEAAGNGVTLMANIDGPIMMGSNRTAVLNYAAPAAHSGSLGNLVVTINTDPGPFDVGLNGEADIGAIATNPVPIAFNTICTGAASTQDVDIYASAAGDVDLTSASVTPSILSVTPVSGTVKGNHANDIMATVTANPSSTGDFTGTLTIVTNIPGMANQDVKITGTAMAGGIAATPDLAHFGSVVAGLVSTEQPIMLTNCGTADMMVSGTSFTGITPLEFTVLSPTSFPLTIPKTQSRSFNVAMTPHSAGPKSAMLVIASDQGPTTVLFDGLGTAGSDDSTSRRETYYGCSVGGGGAAWPIGLALLALRRRRRR